MGSDEYDDKIDGLAARVEVLERDVGIMRGILWQSGSAAQAAPARRTAPQPRPVRPESQGAPPWGTQPQRRPPLGGTPGLPAMPVRTPESANRQPHRFTARPT